MSAKSVPQMTAITTLADTDLVHIVSSNIDYKMTVANLKTAINGTASEIVYAVALDVTTAQVLALFTTPLLLIAAPAAGYHIEILACSCKVTYNSIPYATNVSVNVYTDTATVSQFQLYTALDATVTRNIKGVVAAASGATVTQMIAAKGVYIKADTGNPTAGNSDITVYATYLVRAD